MQYATLIAAGVIAILVVVDKIMSRSKPETTEKPATTDKPGFDLATEIQDILGKFKASKPKATAAEVDEVIRTNPTYLQMRDGLPSIDDRHALDALKSRQMDAAQDLTQEPKT